MKTFKFDETSIPGQLGINFKDDLNLNWAEFRSANFYRVIFSSIADILKINQDKNAHRIGFKFKDDKGNFKFGAILGFNDEENEEGESAANWFLTFTFYEDEFYDKDMQDLDYEYDNHTDYFIQAVNNNCMNIMSGYYRDTTFITDMIIIAIETLKKFLDVNAIEDEEVQVVLKGVFTASVVIENGEKYMSIVPGESIKQAIKNDDAL